MSNWEEIVEPYAKIYENMDVYFRALIKLLSDDELAKLSEAIKRPTGANCKWSVYRVANVLEGMVKFEIAQRKGGYINA